MSCLVYIIYMVYIMLMVRVINTHDISPQPTIQ